MSRFVKATKERANLRCAIFGPSGAGKTMTSLRIATGLGGPIGVICTERHSARKYSDRFAFDVLDLERRTIDDYVQAIHDASKEGFTTLVIDSLSHGWQELLEQIDKLAKTSYKGNSWGAWSEGTPKQKELINAILGYPGHVIATMRSKTEWTVVERGGRGAPDRVGLAPEQGKGIEYEFDLLIELNTEHMARVIKDRTGKFQDLIMSCPGEEFGAKLAAWLQDGSAPAYVPPMSPPESPPLAIPEAQTRRTRLADPGAPTNGRDLFAWCKMIEGEHDLSMLKYINQWGKLQEYPGRIVDWDAEQVALAYAEATRKLRSVNVVIDADRGETPERTPARPSQPKVADSAWSQFAATYSQAANAEWSRELDAAGVDEEHRHAIDATELTNVYRLANVVATAAMEDGSITPDMISHPDDPTKRSMKRIMAAVADIYAHHPEWVAPVCNSHVVGKRAAFRSMLGLDNSPQSPAPAPSDATPAPEAPREETPPAPAPVEPTAEPPAPPESVPTEVRVVTPDGETTPVQDTAAVVPVDAVPEPGQIPKERGRSARHGRA